MHILSDVIILYVLAPIIALDQDYDIIPYYITYKPIINLKLMHSTRAYIASVINCNTMSYHIVGKIDIPMLG